MIEHLLDHGKFLTAIPRAEDRQLEVAIFAPMEARMRLPVEVKTLDSYQGRANHIILLDLVRTNAFGFLLEHGKLLTAITRAEDGLVIFANDTSLGSHYHSFKFYKDLRQYCIDHNVFAIWPFKKIQSGPMFGEILEISSCLEQQVEARKALKIQLSRNSDIKNEMI